MTLHQFGIFLLTVLPFFLLTIWSLLDVSMKTFPSSKEKAAWWLIALIPFAGCVLYLLVGFWRGKKTGPPR